MLQRFGGIRELGGYLEVVGKSAQELTCLALDDGIGAARACGQLGQQRLQQDLRHGAAFCDDLADLGPGSLHAHPQLARADLLQRQDGLAAPPQLAIARNRSKEPFRSMAGRQHARRRCRTFAEQAKRDDLDGGAVGVG